MRVVEIAGGASAAFAGMLLSELGHDVVHVSRADGSSFAPPDAEPLSESALLYLNRAKHVSQCDQSADATEFLELLAGADALIEDLGPGELEAIGFAPTTLQAAIPRLTVVRASPFGQSGPRANWHSSELVLQAMGGVVFSTGFDGEAPLRLAGLPAHFIGGLHLATAALAAFSGVVDGTETAPVIDISLEEAYMHHWARHISAWAYSGHGMRREQREGGRQGFPHTVMAADGWLYVLALNAEWEPFGIFLGLDQFVTHEWHEPRVRAARWEEIAPHYYGNIANRSRYDWFADAAAHGYTFAPIQSMADNAHSPQNQARAFLDTLAVDGQTVLCPGLPFTWRTAKPARPQSPEGGQDA